MATWARAGSTCEIAGDVLTKTRGGNYNRLATTEETMAAGVHEWEVTLTAGATANQSLALYIGVARENLDVEKGGYSSHSDLVTWEPYNCPVVVMSRRVATVHTVT